MLEIIEVHPENLDVFIKLPVTLHSKDPLFVPPLVREMSMQFSKKNPFFMHADAKYFMAVKKSKVVGRIISFVNRRHNEFQNERTGFFGFFDCINDETAAHALFEKAEEHLKSEGMLSIRGPMNFSTNEECGFLLEGFNERPMLMTPYNPPYYNELAESYGLKKVKDLFGFIHEMRSELPGKIIRVAKLAKKRGISVRPIDKKKFHDEMLVFREVYNSAWQNNWGFIPLSEEEVFYAGRRLRQIAIPELMLIAEDNHQPVGFMGLLPDYNYVLSHMKGRLNPLTILKALFYSRKIKDLRLLLLGIKREYRNRGVDALLFMEGFKGVTKNGYKRVEFSWVLEDNVPVQRLAEMIGGKLYKKYRVYEKSL
jgi:hypothetical protein